ncbi:NAD-dependent epimerase/dehydratase family protein, partial [bacterium]|nr:NAD-dependent epimerase/dehydratase family protein [bacterium]
MEKIILILGGTGMLGRPVASALQAAGYKVRIMTRDLEKAQKVMDPSIELVAGDAMNAGTLEQAMVGCFGVHISLPTEVEQQVAESVAKVASRQGVKRISYISGATVAEENCWFPMIKRKYLAEKALRESGVPTTILCPTWVMDGLALFIHQGKAFVFGKQPFPYHWVAAEDIARMVALAYGLGEVANGRFVVHGPEAIAIREALQRYCAVIHPEIKEVSSMPLWLVKMMASATNNHDLKGGGEMMSYFEKIGEGSHFPQHNSILGTPKLTLD